MDIKPKRSLWQYWKDNPFVFPAGAILLGIGLFALTDGVYWLSVFMGAILIFMIVKDIRDFKKNG